MKKHTSEEAYYDRIKTLANVNKTSIKESQNRGLGTLIDYKRAADGVAYGIVKEQHQYYIKKGGLSENQTVADFAYIGGLANITEFQYGKLAEAEKQRNMLFRTINESISTKVSKTGSRKKVNLNEDKTAQEIGDAEGMLGDLDAATAAKEIPVAEPAGDEMAAGLDAEPVGGAEEVDAEVSAEEPAPEGDAGADLEASLGGEEGDAGADLEASLGGEGGEEVDAEVGAEEPAPEGGEEEVAVDAEVTDDEEYATEDPQSETTRELEKQLGKITNTIRKTELEPSQTESYLKSFIQAFKDKLPKLEIEDRKEIAEKITKIIPPEDMEDLGQSVEDSEAAAGIEPKEIKMDTSEPDLKMAAEGVEGEEGGQKTLFKQWFDGERSNEGSFMTGLLELFLKADASNKQKLAQGFPNVFSMDDVYYFTGKPTASNDVAEGQCAECGSFAQYAESRGYGSAEALMECGEEELGNVVSGYANAHGEGMNDGDMENVALVLKLINPEILNQLKGDYGHEEYANQLEPIVTGMNECSQEEGVVKLNELFGGVNATNAPIDPASIETQPPLTEDEEAEEEIEVDAPTVKVADDDDDMGGEPEGNFFANDSQSLGGGVVKPDGAGTTSVEVTKGSVNVTMNEAKAKLIRQIATGVNEYLKETTTKEIKEPKKEVVSESEMKLRKYIRARLEEKAGLRKPILSESKKSDTLKKLDATIDKQFKLYEAVALKKKDSVVEGWLGDKVGGMANKFNQAVEGKFKKQRELKQAIEADPAGAKSALLKAFSTELMYNTGASSFVKGVSPENALEVAQQVVSDPDGLGKLSQRSGLLVYIPAKDVK